jgi:hypothetical protein
MNQSSAAMDATLQAILEDPQFANHVSQLKSLLESSRLFHAHKDETEPSLTGDLFEYLFKSYIFIRDLIRDLSYFRQYAPQIKRLCVSFDKAKILLGKVVFILSFILEYKLRRAPSLPEFHHGGYGGFSPGQPPSISK